MSIGIKDLESEAEERQERARKIIHYLMRHDTVLYTKEELAILTKVDCVGIIVDIYDSSIDNGFPILRKSVIRPQEKEYDWQDSCQLMYHYGINPKWLKSQWKWIEQWNELMNWLSGSSWYRFCHDKPKLNKNPWSWCWEIEHPEEEEDNVI